MCPWFFTSCVAWIVFFLNGLCFKSSLMSFGICSAPYCPFTFLLYRCRGIIAEWLMPLWATMYLLGSLSSSVFKGPEQGWSGWRGAWGGGEKGSWDLAGELICIFSSLCAHWNCTTGACILHQLCNFSRLHEHQPHRSVPSWLLGGLSCPCDLKTLFENEMTQLL